MLERCSYLSCKTYLDCLGEILDSDERSLQKVSNINTLSISPNDISMCIAKHLICTRFILFRFGSRSEVDNNILESSSPCDEVIVIRSAGLVCPGNKGVGVVEGYAIVKALQSFKGNSHINNGFCESLVCRGRIGIE